MVTLLYTNCLGMITKDHALIASILSKYKPLIFVLSETHVTENHDSVLYGMMDYYYKAAPVFSNSKHTGGAITYL